MTHNRGFVLPAVLAFAMVLVAAITPQLLEPAATEADYFKQKQASWFHWQQAAVAYFKKYSTWPSSLTQLATQLSLPAAPNYLYGRRVGSSFRIQLNQLTAEQVTRVQAILSDELTRATTTSVEVSLIDPADEPTAQNSPFKRLYSAVATPAQVNVDLQSHQLNQVQTLNANRLILNDEFNYPNNDVFYVQAVNINAPQGITIKRFTSIHLNERGVGALIRDARELLTDLYAHYASSG